MQFRLKEEFTSLPLERLVTIAIGESAPFVLGDKDLVQTIPASKQGPATQKVIKKATQKQLKKLHDFGHPMIEPVKDQ